MNHRKELITYLVSGGITTAANYVLYAGLLFLEVPWLAANSAAWAGAVITAYILNRRWVFRSRNRMTAELASFVGLRFLTLLTENLLLWLLIDELKLAPFPAKLIVSAVTVTGNYLLSKYRIFKKEAVCHG